LVRLTRLDTNTCCLHNVKSDFHGDISALREQAVNQWREFVVTAVLADYQKSSPHAQSHSNCEIPELTFLRGLIGPLHSTMSTILVPHASALVAVFPCAVCGITIEPFTIAEPQHCHDDSRAFYHLPCRRVGESPTSVGRTT
jgi:hypothetical protein